MSPAQRIVKTAEFKRIAECSMAEIAEAIAYAIMLLGLKGTDKLEKAEMEVLEDFIITEYGRFTCEDLKLAFRFGLSGKTKIDPEIYGKRFSAAYISRFMVAYEQFKINELKVVKQKEPIGLPCPESPEEKQKIDEIIQELKKTYVEPVDKIKKEIKQQGFSESDYNQGNVIDYDSAKILSEKR